MFENTFSSILTMFGGERAIVTEIEGYKVIKGTREQIEAENVQYSSSPAVWEDPTGIYKAIVTFPKGFTDDNNFILFHEIGHIERWVPYWRILYREDVADDYSFERLGITSNKEKRGVIKNLYKQFLKAYGIIPGSVVVFLNLHRFIRLL